MTSPSALLAIQDGSGSTENQGQGYIQQLTPGDTVKFTLQSTAGITPQMRWVLVFESVDTPNLNGLEFTWSPNNSGNLPEFDFLLPPGGFTARYYTSVEDPQNVLSTFTGEIYGNGAGITVTPAPSNGQAIVWNGSGYEPQGVRECINLLSYEVDPTGVADSYAGVLAACNEAIADKLPLYVPLGNYNMSRHVPLNGQLVIEGQWDNNGNPGALRQPTFETFKSGTAATPGLAPEANTPPGSSFWGGSWMGPAFTCMASGVSGSSPVLYTHNHNIYKAQVGGINGSLNKPVMYLTETPASNLNGLTALSFELAFNFHTVTQGNFLVWCGGCKTDHSPYSEPFSINTFGTGSTYGLDAKLTTANGVFTCATSAGIYSVATDYCLAATYDGTTFKLYTGTPGGSATLVASVAATGAVVQHPWQDFIIGGWGATVGCGWPLTAGTIVEPYEWGNLRLSKVARTIATMPSTEFLAGDRDSNTLLMISFDPAYRAELLGVVATCYDPAISGYILAGPGNIYLPWRNINAGSGPSVTFRNMAFRGVAAAECVFANSVIDENCTFYTRKGITRENNSYTWQSLNPVFEGSMWAAGNCGHNWCHAFLNVSGLGTLLNPDVFGASQVNFVFGVESASVLRDVFINTVNGAFGIFCNGAGGDMLFDNVLLANENGSGNLDTFVVFNSMQNVIWEGGGLFLEVAGASGYLVLIDAGGNYTGSTIQTYDINMNVANSAGGGAVTSLYGSISGHAPLLGIRQRTAAQGRGLTGPVPWSDGTIDVVIEPLEENGRSTWNATGAGTITCQWQPDYTSPTGPDFSCRTIVITDSGNHLSGTASPILAPTVNAGHRRRLVIPSTAGLVSMSFGGATGAAVTILAGKTAEVESNGTGWERVTPDT